MMEATCWIKWLEQGWRRGNDFGGIHGTGRRRRRTRLDVYTNRRRHGAHVPATELLDLDRRQRPPVVHRRTSRSYEQLGITLSFSFLRKSLAYIHDNVEPSRGHVACTNKNGFSYSKTKRLADGLWGLLGRESCACRQLAVRFGAWSCAHTQIRSQRID
jgi:hypothetical protein